MKFSPGRLQIARKRNLLNKKALAELIGVSPVYITRWEKGDVVPTKENIDRMSKALDYPVRFFEGDELDFPFGASFRSQTSMTAKMRDAALAAGSLAFLISDWLEESFHLPIVNVPDLGAYEPASAAIMLRHYWGLGEMPVTNMVHLLESKGCRVFSLAENTKKINAYSIWRREVPFIFLNTVMTGERSRFDAAHELAHLVLHQDGETTGREAEDQANAFASSFLMPSGDVLAHARRGLSLAEIIVLKSRWLVSPGALARRLYKLGLTSEWEYRNLCINISKNGYRTAEPRGIHMERSQLWKKVITLLWQEGKTKDHLALELGLPLQEVSDLLFSIIQDPPPDNHHDSELKVL